MGGLSRKRLKPRIVKTKKLKNVKRMNSQKLPAHLQKFWNQDKSLQENFDSMGLILRQNPNIKHTSEGKILRKIAIKQNFDIEPTKKEDVQWVNAGDLKALRDAQKESEKKSGKNEEMEEDDDDDDDEDGEFDMEDEQQQEMLRQLQDEQGEVEVVEEVFSDDQDGEQVEDIDVDEEHDERDVKRAQKLIKAQQRQVLIESQIKKEMKKMQKRRAARKEHSLADVFAGMLPNKEDIVPAIPQAKLRGDDIFIVERLIKKYDDDFDSMYKDIKLNYMQWSKSELKTKYRSYHAYSMDQIADK